MYCTKDLLYALIKKHCICMLPTFHTVDREMKKNYQETTDECIGMVWSKISFATYSSSSTDGTL